MRADVCVVGGGPAGSAAAITLARAGRDVVLVDRARFPRDKCCGDGLTTLALRELEALGLRSDAVPSWQVVSDVAVRSPSGRTGRFSLPRGRGAFAAVARRSELDAAILDLARDAGVQVFDGHALTGARETGDGMALDVDGLGCVHAHYAIGADGQWSPLAKALGTYPDGYRGEWHAFRQYFTDVAPAAATDLWIWFEPDLLPGYAWSFPLPGGQANVGFGVQRGGKIAVGDMGEVWAGLVERPHIREVLGPRARPEAPHRAWPIPARIDQAVLTRGRTLFVGDAACASDPMTGEGIGQALETGALAARSISAAGWADPQTAAADYTRTVRRTLVPDHRMSMLLIRALRHRKGARAAVRIAGATDWTRRNFARWLFEDEPRGVLTTPTRWHRRFLDRDGPYLAN
jgi:menaquinone-9 beta-reductase